MAHITKFKLSSMGQIFAHINRDKNTIRKYDNQDIDTSRSYLNQDIIHGDMTDLNARMSEVSHQKRKDLVACCGVVVTLPVELHSSDLASQNRFFNYCTNFIKEKFGEKNVVYATIHHDETTPHIHIGFVPVTQIERKYRSKAKKGQTYTQERISAKDVVTKSMLNTFHSELDNYITEKLGQKVSILTNNTKKNNLSINELKQKTIDRTNEVLERANSLDNLKFKKKKTILGKVILDEQEYSNLLAKANFSSNLKNESKKLINSDLALNLEIEKELKNHYKNKNIELQKEINSYSSLILENKRLREENNKLNEFKELALSVIKYSLKVLESIKCFDFNSNALSSSLNKILDFCKNNNLSIGRSRSR
jgi:hypothetical protein